MRLKRNPAAAGSFPLNNSQLGSAPKAFGALSGASPESRATWPIRQDSRTPKVRDGAHRTASSVAAVYDRRIRVAGTAYLALPRVFGPFLRQKNPSGAGSFCSITDQLETWNPPEMCRVRCDKPQAMLERVTCNPEVICTDQIPSPPELTCQSPVSQRCLSRHLESCGQSKIANQERIVSHLESFRELTHTDHAPVECRVAVLCQKVVSRPSPFFLLQVDQEGRIKAKPQLHRRGGGAALSCPCSSARTPFGGRYWFLCRRTCSRCAHVWRGSGHCARRITCENDSVSDSRARRSRS